MKSCIERASGIITNLTGIIWLTVALIGNKLVVVKSATSLSIFFLTIDGKINECRHISDVELRS